MRLLMRRDGSRAYSGRGWLFLPETQRLAKPLSILELLLGDAAAEEILGGAGGDSEADDGVAPGVGAGAELRGVRVPVAEVGGGLEDEAEVGRDEARIVDGLDGQY